MPFRLLANLILMAHRAFLVFVVLGGFLALRWRWAGWFHLPAATWGAWIEPAGVACPRTPLENRRRRSGTGPDD